MKPNYSHIEKENKRRQAELHNPYDPYIGKGSYIDREILQFTYHGEKHKLWLPKAMMETPTIKLLKKFNRLEDAVLSVNTKANSQFIKNYYIDFIKLRIEYDFEFWAISTFKITDKNSGSEIPFKLNYPQRAILLPEIERQRFLGIKIRINICKARQWGGSTLTDAYIFYIQNVLKPTVRWNSVIIGEVEDQAKGIRAMYRTAAKKYLPVFGQIELQSYERSKNIQIKSSQTVISVGSMQQPDGLRSQDLKCAHFSEVGLWKKTAGKEPKDLIQTIHGTLSGEPLTFAAYESTAKGVGNFFHTAWLNSITGRSSYKPIFVPWYIIELYLGDWTKEYSSIKEFVDTWNDYEWWLWGEGATVEGIFWYRHKLYGEMEGDTWRMKSEFPTTAEEAFQSTGRPVFHPSYLSGLDIYTRMPFEVGVLEAKAVKGKQALENLMFMAVSTGLLKVWSRPVPYRKDPVKDRYCVSLDIGGASRDADKSIISVIDRIWLLDGDGELEVVASAEFNMDQDLTVWLACQVAAWYNNAMFIPESNSMETEADTEGNHFLTILDEIIDYYDNIYMRTTPDQIKDGVPAKYGFQTNKATKTMVIDNMRALLRENKFVEREPKAISEFHSYEHKEGGKMGGAGTNHDDYVMSRSIGAWGAIKAMELPTRLKFDTERAQNRRKKHHIVGEATI